MISSTAVYCPCHPEAPKKLLVIEPGVGLTAWRNRGGDDKHVGSLGAREVLERLSGTADGSAIVHFVRMVVG